MPTTIIILARFGQMIWSGRRVWHLAFIGIIFLGHIIFWPVTWCKPLSENIFKHTMGFHCLIAFVVLSFDGSISLQKALIAQRKYLSITYQFPESLLKQDVKFIDQFVKHKWMKGNPQRFLYHQFLARSSFHISITIDLCFIIRVY